MLQIVERVSVPCGITRRCHKVSVSRSSSAGALQLVGRHGGKGFASPDRLAGEIRHRCCHGKSVGFLVLLCKEPFSTVLTQKHQHLAS